MKRRQFVSTAGTTAVGMTLAGCTARNLFVTPEDKNVDENSIKITDEEFYTTQNGAGVRGEVKNVSEWEISYLELRATFLDSDGEQTGRNTAITTDLEMQKTWEYDITYSDSDVNEIEEHELTIVDIV